MQAKWKRNLPSPEESYFLECADYVLQSFKDGYEIKYKVSINKLLHSMFLLQIGKL